MIRANCSTDTTCSPSDGAPKSLPSGYNLILLPPRLLAAALYGAADVVKKTFDGSYSDACSVCHGHHPKGQSCCDLPETCCPDPCVCRIRWSGCPGDSFRFQIQVTNTSKTEREFTLVSVPFPFTEEVVKVTPDKKTLATDESFQAVLSFTIPDSFAGSNYFTKVKVIGAYEQYIQVCLAVRPLQACSCHIVQGDIPKRVKAHHWFHHFQCEQECTELSKKAS
ncbi:hypothetical protein [Marinobacter changyiensis]|uniref:COG1470 family protein n=1 Tax=Marinobacter changyiensis TaxID=2604091 RepID=UPI00126485A3|nr:hypothetical protein [Marinobacter changyiensis]